MCLKYYEYGDRGLNFSLDTICDDRKSKALHQIEWVLYTRNEKGNGIIALVIIGNGFWRPKNRERVF
jgi:hypothetical protein